MVRVADSLATQFGRLFNQARFGDQDISVTPSPSDMWLETELTLRTRQPLQGGNALCITFWQLAQPNRSFTAFERACWCIRSSASITQKPNLGLQRTEGLTNRKWLYVPSHITVQVEYGSGVIEGDLIPPQSHRTWLGQLLPRIKVHLTPTPIPTVYHTRPETI
ncbi:hypothetical protein K470DRAFT_146248 [Piedraia hortae CBS 480.64]|uniref:Uncharacterized protein n=1 Tax=Piedraia hortae CBS 480.64 TaxID=1314780 RepID=A0A6A7BUC3_9PEZI|nr:hypothetical protein K470DRAFT_146248 [Piedraia hortae CBS 480.64]